MIIGWWALLPTAVLLVVPFLIIPRKRWKPGAIGWSFIILAVGILTADGFRNFGPVGLALIFFGVVLSFTGVLNGPNSPAN